MGQTVYVLMQLEGKSGDQEWRPVAVVTNPDVAAEWQAMGKEVDWVPLELDDTKHIGPNKAPTEFKPRKVTPNEQTAQQIVEKQNEQIKRLESIVKRLSKRLGIKEDKPQALASLTAKITVPPKPEGYVDVLNDSQDIAYFVDSVATDYVDTDLVYEKYLGSHAELRLVPIDQLTEGGRDHNIQNPANERKYQRMSVKTVPPLLVENGVVMDGNHRLRAAKKRGLTAMWCYVVIEGEVSDANDHNDTESN